VVLSTAGGLEDSEDDGMIEADLDRLGRSGEMMGQEKDSLPVMIPSDLGICSAYTGIGEFDEQ
jgi:hypothetical protein